jgi:hypothetical protein
LIQLIKFRDAFQALAQNSKIGKAEISFTGLNRLEIATPSGNFILEGRTELSTLFYNSPSTGTYKYYYDVTQ